MIYTVFEQLTHFMTIPVLISDASNVLVISTDMAAKPDDGALMYFFR